MKSVRIFGVAVLLFMSIFAHGQRMINDPYYAVSSHPIKVKTIAQYPDSLVLVLSIENQADKGYFCVNKRVYLENPKTKNRTFMFHAFGLPVCPDVYHFKWKGEEKTFYLVFPAMDVKDAFVNVIEDCNDNCFAIYGLILNKEMNEQVNKAYDAYKYGKLDAAASLFLGVVNQHPDYPFGGFLAHVIKIRLQQKNYKEASLWYQTLRTSKFVDKKALMDEVSHYAGFDNISQ